MCYIRQAHTFQRIGDLLLTYRSLGDAFERGDIVQELYRGQIGVNAEFLR
jgi:hypothetical protein